LPGGRLVPCFGAAGHDLFRFFAVELFSIALGVTAVLVDDAILMIGRGVEGIEFQRHSAGVDNVVIDPGRGQYAKPA